MASSYNNYQIPNFIRYKKITQKGFKLVFFDTKFQFFVEFINFIGNFISNTSKCFCVPSKILKKRKTWNFMKKKKGKIGSRPKNKKKQELDTLLSIKVTAEYRFHKIRIKKDKFFSLTAISRKITCNWLRTFRLKD